MTHEQLSRLKTLTEQLRDFNNRAYDQFVNQTKSPDYEVDFFGEVKPFADQVTNALEEWQPLVMDWLRVAKPSYVFVPQIVDAVDNLTIVSVTSFQKDTRRKRFLNTISAIDYTLEMISNQIVTEA